MTTHVLGPHDRRVARTPECRMLSGRTVFAQVMTHVSQKKFHTRVIRYHGDFRASRFSCWDQYLCMAFAQLTYRESLRDIVACLRAVQRKLYHVGIRERVSRSTLADANETRDWRIYADVAHGLIRTGRELYVNEPLAVDLANTVYALDATIIDLCLSVFPWARYRRRDAAVKLHTQVDLRGLIPTVVHITERKRADVTFVDDLVIEPGAIYIMDRGYVDFERLHRFTDEAAFFLTRTKKGIRFRPRVSRPVDFATGLQSDHTVGLATAEARRAYPGSLRRVRYVDPTTTKRLTFLTNNFTVPALAIPQLHKSRWQVETLFSVDQTTSADQSARRRTGEDPDLDRAVDLCLAGHRQEASFPRHQPLQTSADFEHHAVRENAHFYGSFRCRLPIRRHRQRQPIGTILFDL